jgi:hypothetical protein
MAIGMRSAHIEHSHGLVRADEAAVQKPAIGFHRRSLSPVSPFYLSPSRALLLSLCLSQSFSVFLSPLLLEISISTLKNIAPPNLS